MQKSGGGRGGSRTNPNASPDSRKLPYDMPVARLTVEISIHAAQSLKDRRQVVRSIKDKLRHSFNVSIAELDDATLWNRATLGMVAISSSAAYLNGQMQQLDDALHRLANTLGAEILDSFVEILD
jgi:uncharacterized protein YlxP (DUF503 family)